MTLKEFMAKHKPSEIVFEVIEAIKIVEDRQGYKIDMDQWMWVNGSTCHLCAAGAYAVVMGSETRLPKRLYTLEDVVEMSGVPESVLLAIDFLRRGKVRVFLNLLNVSLKWPYNLNIKNREHIRYSCDRDASLRQLKRFARQLKRRGI